MTQILGLSGRKQSGKNTAANFLLGLTMQGIGLIREEFLITDEGQLWVSDILGDKVGGIFDYSRKLPQMDSFKTEFLDPFIKLYSYADLLKQKVCIDVMGLTWKQCYGSDAEKNSITKYRWEEMPTVFTCGEQFDTLDDHLLGIEHSLIYHRRGLMTARDVMQYVGTDLFRKMNGNIWVDALIRQIQQDNSGFAIIADVRFPNEVKGIQDADGKVMRLTRDPFPNDDHDSETALDKNNYDWDNFDWVIDNRQTSVLRQNQLVQEALGSSGWITSLTKNPTK